LCLNVVPAEHVLPISNVSEYSGLGSVLDSLLALYIAHHVDSLPSSTVSMDVWPGNVHLFVIMETLSRTISTMSLGGCAIDVYLVLSERPCTTPVALVIHTHVCCCFIQCTKGGDSLLSFKSIHSLEPPHSHTVFDYKGVPSLQQSHHPSFPQSTSSPTAHLAPSFEQFPLTITTPKLSASCGEYYRTMLRQHRLI